MEQHSAVAVALQSPSRSMVFFGLQPFSWTIWCNLVGVVHFTVCALGFVRGQLRKFLRILPEVDQHSVFAVALPVPSRSMVAFGLQPLTWTEWHSLPHVLWVFSKVCGSLLAVIGGLWFAAVLHGAWYSLAA